MEKGERGMTDFLIEEHISKQLLEGIAAYKKKYPSNADAVRPKYPYYGRKIWEEAISAVLSGANLLLEGPKATGKNKKN